MKLFFAKEAFEDYCYWKETEAEIFAKINLILKNIKDPPTKDRGNPVTFNWIHLQSLKQIQDIHFARYPDIHFAK